MTWSSQSECFISVQHTNGQLQNKKITFYFEFYSKYWQAIPDIRDKALLSCNAKQLDGSKGCGKKPNLLFHYDHVYSAKLSYLFRFQQNSKKCSIAKVCRNAKTNRNVFKLFCFCSKNYFKLSAHERNWQCQSTVVCVMLFAKYRANM